MTSSSVAEEEKEKEKEGSHPLLDFITAADVFMYLGDVTYGLCSSVLYWIGLYWIGLDWIGLDWIGLDCIGLDCIV